MEVDEPSVTPAGAIPPPPQPPKPEPPVEGAMTEYITAEERARLAEAANPGSTALVAMQMKEEDEYCEARRQWEIEMKDPMKSGVGKVFVEYVTVDEAHHAQVNLAGKRFGGRTVITAFLPEDYKQKILDDDEKDQLDQLEREKDEVMFIEFKPQKQREQEDLQARREAYSLMIENKKKTEEEEASKVREEAERRHQEELAEEARLKAELEEAKAKASAAAAADDNLAHEHVEYHPTGYEAELD
eukprot:NODE_3807_length_849_cov_52.734072_g3784_i0.p1 GENE.NODE_3807_length_849_cov_52.734072_g3784_i0~~NODE_3807_length_849_cov_52.734072_g3784_i0.p1  ORF type:complete len:273 (+),score=101.22 NODE_3807_length_849_cov_52.734072_g3784_i0:88-819(+)